MEQDYLATSFKLYHVSFINFICVSFCTTKSEDNFIFCCFFLFRRTRSWHRQLFLENQKTLILPVHMVYTPFKSFYIYFFRFSLFFMLFLVVCACCLAAFFVIGIRSFDLSFCSNLVSIVDLTIYYCPKRVSEEYIKKSALF